MMNDKYWIGIQVFERHADVWYWKVYCVDTIEDYEKDLLRTDIRDIKGLGKLKTKQEAEAKLENCLKSRLQDNNLNEKKEPKRSVLNGWTIWAIIQTVLALKLILEAQNMTGFNAFFAITVGIGWIWLVVCSSPQSISIG